MLGLLCLALWSACSGPSALDGPNAGRSVSYEPGVPSFDLEAIPTVRDGQPGVDVYTSIPRASLVFTTTDSTFVARYDLALRIRDEQGRETEWFSSFRDTLSAPTAEAARSFDRVWQAERIPLAPGTYVVEGVLEDGESGEEAVRRQRVEVFARDGVPRLSRPLVLADAVWGEPAAPVVALHTPARRDSLQTQVEVYDAPAGSALALRILRLRADTTVALPPFWLAPPRGSLTYRGVDDEAADTVATERVRLAGMESVTFDLPALPMGLYRLDFQLLAPDGTTLARQRRALSVKGAAFPQLATLAELVDALDYIAYPREMELIASGTTPSERRRRFDAFWGGLVSDRRVASNLLRQYYERVEEANLLFTSYKLGWKTDRGMLYVIYGAPDYVEVTFEGEVWHYGYDPENPATSFIFERVDEAGDGFGHYVLVRQPLYEQAWTRAIDRWRRGEAL
ncbi:MAG: GWxTD domain-containing protein [Rhodothermales bacterium]